MNVKILINVLRNWIYGAKNLAKYGKEESGKFICTISSFLKEVNGLNLFETAFGDEILKLSEKGLFNPKINTNFKQIFMSVQRVCGLTEEAL